MAKNDFVQPERLMDIGPGMGLWRMHVDSLRERDVNARVMDDDKFRRLAENIRNEKGLESFPLAHRKVTVVNENGAERERVEFELISGHHRTRAARTAGILIIPVIVIERELSEDEISAKQISHNALNGHDDLETLRRMYDSIDDPMAKMSTGLTDLEFKLKTPSIAADALEVEFEFEPIYILFMASNLERWEHLLDRIEPDARLYAARYEDFDRFVGNLRTIAKLKDVRNIAGMMVALMDMAEKGLLATEAERAAEVEA